MSQSEEPADELQPGSLEELELQRLYEIEAKLELELELVPLLVLLSVVA